MRPTLENIATESPEHLRKFKDPESGLTLKKPAVQPVCLRSASDQIDADICFKLDQMRAKGSRDRDEL